MIQLALAVLILCWAGPAQAALSATEKAEIRKVHDAIERQVQVWNGFGQSLTYRTTATTTIQTNIWTSVITLQTDLTRAYVLLLYVNPAAPGDTATYNTYEALARSGWVSEAFTTLSAVQSDITATKSLIATAQAIAAQDPGYYTGLTIADTALTEMAAFITSFNTGLAYTGARDTPWFPHVVTPHGTFIDTTRFLFEAMQQITAAMSTLKLVFNAAAQGEAPLTISLAINTAFFRSAFAAAELLEKFTSTLHTWVDIPRLNHCQFSPHHTMARIVERLTQISSESTSATSPHKGGEFAGAPYRFHMATTVYSDVLQPLQLELQARPLTWQKMNLFLAHWFKSWQASDGAVWKLMEFPAGVTIASLRVQAGRTNDTHIPPLCPDTIAPEVLMVSPANGATISGWQAVVAECKDTIGTPATIADGSGGESQTLCAKMELKIDGVIVVTPTNAPYAYQWDTTLTTNGAHSVQAIGYDAAGNAVTTSTHNVTVAN